MTDKTINVLVTGAGGDIGQSIGKILIEQTFVNKLVGVDISDKNAGKFIYNHFLKAVHVADPNYIQFLKGIITEYSIDIVIISSEPELRFIQKIGVEGIDLGVSVITANQLSLDIGLDKYETANFLRENGFPYPRTERLTDVVDDFTLPYIVKPRWGSGSKGIYVVKEPGKLDCLKMLVKKDDFIIQKYVEGDEGELTCCVYKSNRGDVRCIQFKRVLMGGFSGYGEIVAYPVVDKLLKDIADALNLVGSINIQLRMKENIPYVFEINPRFSSTVYFRHLFGFRDVIWSVYDTIELKVEDYVRVENMSRFYKGFNEYID